MTDTVKTALELGYRPVPMRTINQRLVPFHYQHSGGTYGYDDLDLYRVCRTFALVLLDCVLIDVDGHKDGADLASIKRDLAALFDMSISDLDDHILQDQISRQSIHYLMRLPEDVDFTTINQHNHSRLINYVDFKTGRQLVYIKDVKRQHWRHIDDLHRIDSTTVYKIFGRRVAVIDDPDVSEFAALVRRESRSRDDVISMITKCDPNCDYDTWIRIGMAVASWDSSDEGLKVWDDWSAGGESYQIGECAIKWRSFGSVGGVTLGTLVHLSNAATQSDMITETQRICNNILTSDYNQLRVDIKASIRDFLDCYDTTEIDRAVICDAYTKRLKKLTGGSVSKTKVAKELFKRSRRGQHALWDDWLYILSLDCYYNVNNGEAYSRSAFDLACTASVPVDPNTGTRASASRHVAQNALIDIVHGMEYMPLVEDQIIEMDQGFEERKRYLNIFMPNSIPKPRKKVSKSGSEYIRQLKDHLALLCGSEDHGWILEQWIAHQVQKPGHKILWAPVIQSIQGAGKSYIAQLLKVLLGDINVKVISPSEVTNNFNGWAVNSCVNVLEELRVQGRNRNEAMNALKPLITDKKIQISDKYIKAHERVNTSNYICFTNFKNSIPVDATDRRWWVVFSELKSLDDIPVLTGKHKVEYFDGLFQGLSKYREDLITHFHKLQISKEFLDTKQAPLTAEKLAIEATERSRITGFRQIKALIDDPNYPHANKDHINFDEVGASLFARADALILSNDEIARICGAMGLSKKPGDNNIWVANVDH